jgi:hypothetical protein
MPKRERVAVDPIDTRTNPLTPDTPIQSVVRMTPEHTRTEPAVDSAPVGARFALTLYKALASSSGNLLFSPHSIRAALAMACEGARGETGTQMRHVLGLDDSPLSPGLIERQEDQTTADFVSANSLWTQIGAPLEAQFLANVASKWGGSVMPADFQGHPAAARAAVNEWVQTQTRGKISELLPEGVPVPDTRLILVNAVYFKASWASPFLERRTRPAPFNMPGRRQIDVQMMSQKDAVAYHRGLDYQAIRLDMASRRTAMLLILPDEIDGLPELERTLDPASLESLLTLPAAKCRSSCPDSGSSGAQPISPLRWPDWACRSHSRECRLTSPGSTATNPHMRSRSSSQASSTRRTRVSTNTALKLPPQPSRALCWGAHPHMNRPIPYPSFAPTTRSSSRSTSAPAATCFSWGE